MLKKKGLRDWIVIDASKKPPVFKCMRCGGTREIFLPAPLEDFAKQGEAFNEAHKRCIEEDKNG